MNNDTEVNLNIGQQAKTADLTGATTTPGAFIGNLLEAIMSIAALLLLFYLIWGAIEWITAGGDQSKIQKGRDRIVQSIIGIIVLASSVAIFIVVQQFLGINVIQFNNTIIRTTNPRDPSATNAPNIMEHRNPSN